MASFMILDRMWERLRVERDDSDTARFLCLMYFGEMLAKLIVSGLVACIEDDVSRSRYRQNCILVRADGIGEWVQVLDEIVAGPTAQFLCQELRVEQRELTERLKAPHWGHAACVEIAGAYRCLGIEFDALPERVDARRWFSLFATLRNRTRGHGATRAGLYTQACPHLENSIRIICENLSLLTRPWAFLHQNLSGKYRVTQFSENEEPFRALKTSPSKLHLEDGVYIHVGIPRLVELITSDVDATDFLFPNGLFNGKRFEIRSYLTDTARERDAAPYLKPAGGIARK